MSVSRTRIWFALFVLAIFLVGLGSGLVLGRRMGPPPRGGGPPLVGIGRGGPGGPGPGRLIERLGRELQLTPEQRTQVEAIFEARRPRLEEVQKEMLARADREQQELQAEIRKVLTPEQQQRFERWLADAPRGRGGRGRGGPR
jgi:Spy/CpxP family protein refolding chaperone